MLDLIFPWAANARLKKENAQLREEITDMRVSYMLAVSQLNRLTDRDERGRFVKREGI